MPKSITDAEIVALYFARDERAIVQTEKTHGALIRSICRAILKNNEDAEECCNTVYYLAWSKIPPDHPRSLPAYLSFLARGAAIDLYRKKTRLKRAGELDRVPFEELENLLGDEDLPERRVESGELTEILNRFLASLPEDERRLFVRRYYFEDPPDRIAKDRGISRRTLYVHLSELRDKLEQTLRKEGYFP